VKSQHWHYLSSLTFVTAPFLVINIVQEGTLHLDDWSNLFNIMQLKELELLYVNVSDYTRCWVAVPNADNRLNSRIDVCLRSAMFVEETFQLPFASTDSALNHINLISIKRWCRSTEKSDLKTSFSFSFKSQGIFVSLLWTRTDEWKTGEVRQKCIQQRKLAKKKKKQQSFYVAHTKQRLTRFTCKWWW